MRGLGLNRLIVGAALSVLPAFAGAQQPARPDFSGRWTIAPSTAQAPSTAAPGAARGRGAAQPPGDLGPGWGSTITIAQSVDTLTVAYAFFTRGDMQPPLTFTFALDGRETKNSVMMGRGFQTERSKAAWDGQALVITTLHDFTDPSTGKPATFEVTRTLSLESPDTLIVEVTRGDAPPARVVYRRATGGAALTASAARTDPAHSPARADTSSSTPGTPRRSCP